jgi:hypothetical protein
MLSNRREEQFSRQEERAMIQVQAFFGYAENGQMACNKATKRANRWLKEHPEALVQSMQATHSSVIAEGVAGMEYVVTLLVKVEQVEDEDYEEEEILRELSEPDYDCSKNLAF